eukprot:GHVL01044189.1.p1 GENE.GHVL01044189.1~~GHVL01044189.1.p1  ORF type:complete len:192 (+),score=15.39 GHVL01044189.1:460-1035(+)
MRSKKDLSHSFPSSEEMQFIHSTWLHDSNNVLSDSNVDIPSNSCLMEQTVVSSHEMMQPDHRNLHGNMFGGYIARKATELSWICAQMFFNSTRPVVVGSHEIHFELPVPVGTIAKMTSMVVYTTNKNAYLQVGFYISDPVTKKTVRSNIFYYEYAPPKDWGDSPCPRLIPKSYKEFVLYIGGSRRDARNDS